MTLSFDDLLKTPLSKPLPKRTRSSNGSSNGDATAPRKISPAEIITRSGLLFIETVTCTRCGSQDETTCSEPLMVYHNKRKRVFHGRLPVHIKLHEVEWQRQYVMRDVPACRHCIAELDASNQCNVFERQMDLFHFEVRMPTITIVKD